MIWGLDGNINLLRDNLGEKRDENAPWDHGDSMDDTWAINPDL